MKHKCDECGQFTMQQDGQEYVEDVEYNVMYAFYSCSHCGNGKHVPIKIEYKDEVTAVTQESDSTR